MNIYIRFIVGWLLLGQLAHTTFAQTTALVEPQIDQVFQTFAQQDDFQGAVLVGYQNEVLYEKAFGLANREWDIANTVETKFNLASISKQFTAAIILQLVEEGELKLNQTIADYYPQYRKDVGKQVTLHQLLTHQSGIPNYTSLPSVWSDSLYRKYSREELVNKFASGDLEFKPGSQYQYNNSGYLILSRIIEQVTAKPFDKVFEERIAQPLGLQYTGTDDRQKIIPQRASGYAKTSGGYENVYSMYMQNLQGAGNLYGTVGDLFQWGQTLFGEKLLSAKAVDRMTRPYTDVNQQWIPPYENRYGYGLGIAKIPLPDQKPTAMAFHSGHIRGFSGFFAYYPAEEYTVIILSNTGEVSTARMNLINLEVAQVLNKVLAPNNSSKASPKASTKRKSKKKRSVAAKDLDQERDLEKAMTLAWEAGGAEAARQQYHTLLERFPYDYPDTQAILSRFSQSLLKEKDTEGALAIAELNSRSNPHWQTFTELAILQQQAGQKDVAAQYYQKAISVNPNRTEEEQRAFQAAQKALKILL
ncbi:serine hydrolase domain-containing protein [Tunicatimonas pelagia]|uniref:serine hydrolase domain-containing protein n=1 Tax=Tunicatimonas pelagia TaxID=931531 RepID=UPI002665886D|nr:serine hydrolase domain-containing protein [Tunicatimonas pelagia]WKN41917.1 serine hydrolase [Tunicatimonas pelagia]